MYERKERVKELNSRYITTFSREIFTEDGKLTAEAGTDATMSDNLGEDSVSYIRFDNIDEMKISMRPFSRQGSGGIEIIVEGDECLDAVLRTLRFITDVLDDQYMERED